MLPLHNYTIAITYIKHKIIFCGLGMGVKAQRIYLPQPTYNIYEYREVHSIGTCR